jgi:sugar phosphate isomerase/epimerase
MILAAGLPALPLEFAPALRVAAGLGFTHVEVAAREERPDDDLEALADSGLYVAAVDLRRDLPPGIDPTAANAAARREAVERIGRQIADAGMLGATHAALTLRESGATPAQVGEVLGLLADAAGRRMVRLCVGPSRLMAELVGELRHPHLGLLCDATDFEPGEVGMLRLLWPADASRPGALRLARFDGVVSLWAGEGDALQDGKRRLDSLTGA